MMPRGPNSSMQMMTSGSPSPAVTLPSAMSFSSRTRFFSFFFGRR